MFVYLILEDRMQAQKYLELEGERVDLRKCGNSVLYRTYEGAVGSTNIKEFCVLCLELTNTQELEEAVVSAYNGDVMTYFTYRINSIINISRR